jgi:hypothetical protein
MKTLKSMIKAVIVVSATTAIAASAIAGMNGAGMGGDNASPGGQYMNSYQTGDHPEDGTGMQYGYARNFRQGLGPQQYNFDVDISDDVFVNPGRFGQVTGGMNFVDENGDGICDLAQDSEAFQALGIGPFVDENEDGIHDAFQTRAAYRALGMNNFVDVDGDGICDNYEANPLNN